MTPLHSCFLSLSSQLDENWSIKEGRFSIFFYLHNCMFRIRRFCEKDRYFLSPSPIGNEKKGYQELETPVLVLERRRELDRQKV